MNTNNSLIKSSVSKSPNKIDYFLVLLLTLFSGRGNPIFWDVRYAIIPIIIAFVVYIQRGGKYNKTAEKIYLVFALYILAYFVKFGGEFDPLFTYRIFTYITFSYLVVKVVGKKFFNIYENIIYVLAFISLPFFLLQAVAYNSIYPALYKLQGILNIPYFGGMEYTNVIVYTMNKGMLRNCGFAWEPGAFSNFLVLGIIINLARNKFNFNNKVFWILLIALVLTFSTTGYLAFAFVVIWYLFNVKFNKSMLLIPVAFVSAIYLSTLPFMAEKIISLSTDPEMQLENIIFRSYETHSRYSLGRFSGFLLDLENLKNNPIIGYGGHGEFTMVEKLRIRAHSTNGLGKWMAMFGTVGVAIFFYTYIQSFKNLARLYDFQKPIILLGAILVLGFSFGIIQSALFFAFMLSYLTLPYTKYKISNR